jgi:hypothetical protein
MKNPLFREDRLTATRVKIALPELYNNMLLAEILMYSRSPGPKSAPVLNLFYSKFILFLPEEQMPGIFFNNNSI